MSTPQERANNVARLAIEYALKEPDAQARINLGEVRRAVQELRMIHHALRHPHIDGCAECISLAWLKDNGF